MNIANAMTALKQDSGMSFVAISIMAITISATTHGTTPLTGFRKTDAAMMLTVIG